MVLLLATGVVPPAVAGLAAAGAIVLSGVLSIEQAYRGIGWTTVILVAGMIPLSTAMTETGAAARLADGLVDVLGDAGPRALLFGLVLLVLVLGQLISNMATALIVIPIAVSAAVELGVSPKPLLVAVAVAAAAAFMTPVATPANLMVKEPGGYGFGDYWKLGLPLLALFGLVAVFLVPVFCPSPHRDRKTRRHPRLAALIAPAAARADIADERALAERFAPVVRLVEQPEECGPGEPYEPFDVDVLFGEQTVALRGPWIRPTS